MPSGAARTTSSGRFRMDNHRALRTAGGHRLHRWICRCVCAPRTIGSDVVVLGQTHPSIAERAAAPLSPIPSLSPPLLSHPTFLAYHRIATDPCPLLLPFSACVLTQRVSSGPGTPAEASPRGKSSPGMLNPGTPGHHHSQLVGLSGRQMSTEASQERVRRAPHPHCFI